MIRWHVDEAFESGVASMLNLLIHVLFIQMMRQANTAGSAASVSVTHSLNVDQRKVFRAVLSGQNIFFTGSAGTGKSFLLKKIIGKL